MRAPPSRNRHTAAYGPLRIAPLLALCVAAGGALGYALYPPIHGIMRPPAPRHPALTSWVGKRLPAISQWTLDGVEWAGPERGRPMVLVFWSTECALCLEELSELSSLQTLLAGAVAMVGFPVQTDAELVACVTSRKGVAWQQLRGEPGALINPLAVALDIRRLPSIWVVDGEGIIRAQRLEGIQEARKAVAEVLARRP